MITEKEFVSNAVRGMGFAIIFAFLVLLISTHNIIMAFYAIFIIAGIVVSVCSIMEFSSWELGVAESISIVILIGLSVDFVVHLANHYVESVYPDKHRRM
jgi:predicted RND superfamily exporter protein